MRELLWLAGPLVVSNLSWTIMNFVDRLFLMRYSEAAVAAALPAGALFFMLTCLPMGIASYATTFVAQYHGAGRDERIGASIWQGIWLSLAASPPIMATLFFAEDLFLMIGHAPQIAELETIYFQICCVSAPALISAAALAGFFAGRGRANVLMVVDMIAAVINIVLDYGMIFGHFGFPAWGVAGAAWATVIALWFKPIVYFLWFMLPQHERLYRTWTHWRWDSALMRRLLRFGGPNGAQMFIEVAAFSIFLLLIGRLGETELAASSLAFNVNNLAFMPAWGVSMATQTLVGRYLGQNRDDLAARATWCALTATTLFMAVLTGLYILSPEWVLFGFWEAGNVAEEAELRTMLTNLLLFVGSYCIFDGLNVVFAGALKGAGDTRFIMFTNLTLGVSVVTATWLGITQWGLRLYGSWTILTLWVFVLGTTFMARFLHGRWRQMRVIEEEPISLD